MSRNMTITSNDGRVDVIQAPDETLIDSSLNQGYQQGQGHPDQIEDVVSIGVALSTVDKLQAAKDDVELMRILGIDEDKARKLTGQLEQKYQELPGQKLQDEAYMYDAVREVVIDMLTSKLGNEEEVVVDYRLFETRVADKIREKESDPRNRDSGEKKSESVDTGSGGSSD